MKHQNLVVVGNKFHDFAQNNQNIVWARLIQKIYEVDPLVCPKCQGQMKIIFFI